MDKSSNKINLFALGGASLKMLSYMDNVEDSTMPVLNTTYIDTSLSESQLIADNMTVKILDVGKNLAGSGAVKATHYPAIAKQVPIIVNATQETDINYVVMSVSGATGSTCAFTVIDSLLQQKKSVVVFATSTPTSLVRAKNTSKTLASLDNLAKKYNVVIPVYLFGEQGASYAASDKAASGAIVLTTAMLSTTIVGIDDMDRKNFLNPMNIPDNATGMHPGLYEIRAFIGNECAAGQSISGCLTLVPFGESDDIGTGATSIYPGQLEMDFHNKFLVNANDGEEVGAISLLLNPQSIYEYTENLVETIDEMEQTNKLTRVERSIDLGANGTDNGDGCIL